LPDSWQAVCPRGYATKIDDGRPFGEALLDPTMLYAKMMRALCDAGIIPHYAVNIMGHGWRKLMRHSSRLTYRISQLPAIPPVLDFIRREAALSYQDAYGTFNMGAGFAIFIKASEVEAVCSIAASVGIEAMRIGAVEHGDKRVIIEPIDVMFDATELRVRT